MAPERNQRTKAVVVSSNGKGNENDPGITDARACVRARARGGDDGPVSPVSSSSSASASSSASPSPVSAPVPSSSSSAAVSTGNRVVGGSGGKARWMSAPEQARLKYVHVRAAASYIGVLRSPFFPQDGAAYLAHLASVKARELEKMRAKLEARLSKDAKAKSKSKLKSSEGSSSSLWALLPVVGVSGGFASCWVPLYHGGGGGASKLLLLPSVEHGYHNNDNDNYNDNDNVEGSVKSEGGKAKGKAVSAAAASSEEEAAAAAAAAAAGTEPPFSSSTSGDDRSSGGNEGSPRGNPSNRVNTSIDTLPSAFSSSEAFAAAAGTFDTIITSDTPSDTTSAANRDFSIRRGLTPPSSPCPPAPRLAPLLKGKTDLTEDFLSVVLAKPNPFTGFWTVKCPDSDNASSPGPENIPFPSAAEYMYEANRRVRQVSLGQPSLSARDYVVAAGSGDVHADKRNKKMKKQKWKQEGSKGSKLRAPESAMPPVSVVWGSPSRAWPLPRWQGHIRNGDVGHQSHNQHMYMDEGYVRRLWSEKLEPHQQFARLRKAELALYAGQKRELAESGIEGLITSPTGRTHHELELMVGEAQFDFRSSSRQVVSAPDLVYRSSLASSVAEPAHHHTGLSAAAAEPRTSTMVVDAIIAPATAVEAAPITLSSSFFSATAIPFVPRSLAPNAPKFVPTGQGSGKDSLSATAEEFVPPLFLAPAAVVPQQHQSSAVKQSSMSSETPSLVQQQQHQSSAAEQSSSSLDPGRVNSWTDHRRDHPRAPRHLRPSRQGHQRNHHQPEFALRRLPSVSFGSWSFPSHAFLPPCEPQAATATEEKKKLPPPSLFDPTRPDFEENFPPLGHTPSHAHTKAKLSKSFKQQQQQQFKANSHHVVVQDDHGRSQEDIYAASPILQSASATAVASTITTTTGNNTTSEKSERIKGTISSDGDGATFAGPDETGGDSHPQPQLLPDAPEQYYNDAIPSIYSAEEKHLLLQANHSVPATGHPPAGTPYPPAGLGLVPLPLFSVGTTRGPLTFPPAPSASYPHGYGCGYDQPPSGPPHAHAHAHAYVQGYHHQPSQPLHPQRRVHFADYNTVIHFPSSPSPWGNVGGVWGLVPQQCPDGDSTGFSSASTSGFGSHYTPAFLHHNDAGPNPFPPRRPTASEQQLPLPAPYNYFSCSSRLIPSHLFERAQVGFQQQQQQQQQSPPVFNSGYHHAAFPAFNAGSVPPFSWEILEMVNVLDLVEDLRSAGVVEREAEAWQLRAPVGERTWDLSFGEGSWDVQGEVEEIRLEEVSVVVRELVKEIDEFDD
ncbi:hypothetical protein NCU08496 [Neurospora crassa OR74A]|uniref:Uncharacterized protein n=2 Tax=Neurospora crassa TaxID=5141 RepID=Q1K8P9_NEUCR|nr:hypothetical protein NCU08496 [Neurospora crassa OR74A]EAA34189.1 hypothetical protein NCU08496 [Neurospora crassa OR74A]CAD11425.1 hypothetical protein [Neurospora crassa]|eukprot:XP_963425.1 hypothetical protein NCU08496 [Neurospora crassa OR74A]